MSKIFKNSGLLLVGFVIVVIFSSSIFALEKYPGKPVQLIVPWGPGSGSDLGSRVLAEKMAEFLGQSMVSVFKTGGGGGLASAYVACSKPDGYILLVGSETNLAILPVLKKDLTYNLDSFAYVGAYSKCCFLFSVRPDAPWKTLPDVIADAKKRPTRLKVGIPGVFTNAHVAWELLCQKAGIESITIPFNSTGEVLTALLGGHVDVSATTGVGGIGQARTVRMLAVAEKQRLSFFPDIPTLYELGYPIELSGTFSLCAPKGTPKEIIEIIYNAQEKAFNKYGDEIKQKLERVEQISYFVPGEEYYKILKEKQKIYLNIGKALNLLPK